MADVHVRWQQPSKGGRWHAFPGTTSFVDQGGWAARGSSFCQRSRAIVRHASDTWTPPEKAQLCIRCEKTARKYKSCLG